MNIKPRLDKDIPKKFLYLTVGNGKRNQDGLDEIKGKKDKESVKSRKQYKEYIETANNLHQKLNSGDEVNLYASKETVSDFTRKGKIDFDYEYVLKIDPVCMHKAWQNYGRDKYELYSFNVDQIFYNEESLMKSLKKDRIVKDYILNKFLDLCYGNENYVAMRNEFMEYVMENYIDDRPAFCDIIQHSKDKGYESSSTYKVDEYKTKYYREAYEKGFIKLYSDYTSEQTIIFLLKNRMFDLITELLEQLNDYDKDDLIKFGERKSDNIKCIKELLMNNLDDQNCKMLYDLCGFKSPGFRLSIVDDNGWNEDLIVDSKTFDTVEELKKYLIRNYECNMDRVYKGQFEELWVNFLDGSGECMEVKVEYVE